MSPIRLSTSAVAQLSGASYRMLDHWARTGLLSPSGRAANGKGSRREYTHRDVVAIITICKLRERKCPLRQIRTAVEYLTTHLPAATASDAIASLTLITDGKRVYLLSDEREVMEIVTRQWVWSVPLGMLISEATRKVGALPKEWIETIRVGTRDLRLTVSEDAESKDYVVACRELPGVLERAKTPRAAIEKSRKRIASLLAFREKRQQRDAGKAG